MDAFHWVAAALWPWSPDPEALHHVAKLLLLVLIELVAPRAGVEHVRNSALLAHHREVLAPDVVAAAQDDTQGAGERRGEGGMRGQGGLGRKGGGPKGRNARGAGAKAVRLAVQLILGGHLLRAFQGRPPSPLPSPPSTSSCPPAPSVAVAAPARDGLRGKRQAHVLLRSEGRAAGDDS